MNAQELWMRYRTHLCVTESLGISLDISRMRFADDFMARMAAPVANAFAAMDALEAGAIANPDEGRRVGHYWLRAPELAPEPALTEAITSTAERIRQFTTAVHDGTIRPEREARFEQLLVIGIGGSALGPQFVADALGSSADRLAPHFFDNTDPDGMARVLERLGDRIATTLTLVISKSGGTRETRNGMLVADAAYRRAGLVFAKHAVAVTGDGSELDRTASAAGWLARFPMWDWVGGRTSVFSAVGLLPAALQGIDIAAVLDGARTMDVVTRRHDVASNPAALLALMWHYAGAGRGTKDMVVLPYKDRLLLFSRYLQQLVMESLGKERDLAGAVVHQGMAVYGNKGSTDQHAYVQQLRDGIHNFFLTFVEVLADQSGAPLEVEPRVTSGDYLLGFMLGTREAMYENARESITLTLPDAGPRSVGALIALYERAVGLYASLVNVNAYHQPGVEAGKKAATAVLGVQHAVLDALEATHVPHAADEIAVAANVAEQVETVYKVLEHLAANGRVWRTAGATPTDATYRLAHPLLRLQQLGQSPWHDNIRRDLLTTGALAQMIADGDITGLTSNPTIFEQAIAKSDIYDAEIRSLAKAGKSTEAIFEALAIADIRDAADLFLPVYQRTAGGDGYVSIEVSPRLAHDTAQTLAEARRLWAAVARPNLMVKIPATVAGLGAIEAAIAEGMNVNVTLIFSLDRYASVIDAYLSGLQQRAAAGGALGGIASVASFFVSRVDSAVDKLLDAKLAAGAGDAVALRSALGQAAIANAKLAYELFRSRFDAPAFAVLAAGGARRQRPLWASTSSKNPNYPDTYYVDALVGSESVNTMPPATIAAFKDHGSPAARLSLDIAHAHSVIEGLAALGVDFPAVLAQLEADGVASFATSYETLLEVVAKRAAG